MLLTHPGLVCPVGLQAAAACAAFRAGIAAFAELPYVDNSGEPIVGSAVPSVPPGVKREDRLLFLLTAALKECLASASFERTDSVPLLVGLAEKGRPGGGESLTETLIPRVEKQLGRRFHPSLSRCVMQGHAAGIELLKLAREMLRDERTPACIVAGADSYLNAATLAWLDRHGRLKRAGNSDGVIPGEAAAAMVAQRSNDGQAPVAGIEVAGIGFGLEQAGVLQENPLLGLGLAAAAKEALAEAGLGFHEIDFRLSDVSGESYGFKEQVLMMGRLMRQRRPEIPLWHAADSIGDTGAAAALCHCIVAHSAWSKSYAPGQVGACFACSVPGERGVVILRQFQRGEILSRQGAPK